jgi:hypothetical protein
MDKKAAAQACVAFLERVQLSGAEVPAWMAAMTLVQSIASEADKPAAEPAPAVERKTP